MNTATAISLPPPTSPSAEDAALTYLLRQANHLARKIRVERCRNQLMGSHDLSFEVAEGLALQAFADLESRNCRGRIEIDASTSSMVMIRMANGQRLALTIRDLLAMYQMQTASGALTPVAWR